MWSSAASLAIFGGLCFPSAAKCRSSPGQAKCLTSKLPTPHSNLIPHLLYSPNGNTCETLLILRFRQ